MQLPEEGDDFEHRRRANAALAKVVAAGRRSPAAASADGTAQPA
jgi:hypothetical protein